MSRIVPRRETGQLKRATRYRIPAGQARSELVIKRSTFIGVVGHAPDAQAAQAFVARARAAYPGAAHHAWAFKIGGWPQGLVGSSDDGEPGGTAGRPMLAVLEGSGLREVVAVGVRYFGGIKLGPGGLVRAYSGVIREALCDLETTECVLYRRARVAVGYDLYGGLQHTLARHRVIVEEATFADGVVMLLAVPYEQAGRVADLLRGLSRGQIALDENWLEDRYYVREG